MTLRSVLGGVLLGGPLVVCLLACNEVAGIEKPLDGTGTGTGTGTGNAALARFVGDWRTPNGTFALKNCRNATSGVGMAILHLRAGDTPNTIVVTPDLEPSCHIKCVLGSEGDTLTLVPQQRCDVATSMEIDHYDYVDTTTIKIDAAGNALNAHILANVTSDVAPGVECLYEEMNTYTKQ